MNASSSEWRDEAKHYIDRKEIAKDMVERGFRVFPQRPSKEIQRTLPQDTVSNKKDPVISQGLYYQCGAYRNQTDDLLIAKEDQDFPPQLHYTIIHYITKTM